ncbi:MAG: transposase [Saprospiraceae bacterium]|nr:transposase [Saprospiraceae bacterium]
MRKPDTLELYVDYLIAHQGLVSAKDLSEVLGNALSHDHITWAIAQPELHQKDFWKLVKPFIRRIERDDGCIAVDDFIVEKPHSTPNSIITVNRDHSKQQYSLGINVLNFLYTVASEDETMQVKVPLAFEVVSKTEAYMDKKSGKEKVKSPKTKNELMRERLAVLCHQNQVRYRYVLWDTWFCAADNMKFVVQELGKHFVGAIKENRKVALVGRDGKTGAYKPVSQQELQPNVVYKVHMESVPFDLFLVNKVYKNMDGSTGVVFLVTSDGGLDAERIFQLYQKRWKVEESHKSVKQNVGIAQSPTKMERSQKNHLFASMWGLVQLQGKLKIAHKKNHFALKHKIYLTALKAAWEEIRSLKCHTVNELDFQSL